MEQDTVTLMLYPVTQRVKDSKCHNAVESWRFQSAKMQRDLV